MSNLPKHSDFKDSLVAFVDILGFDKKVRDINSEEGFLKVAKLLHATKETADNFSKADGLFEEFEFTAISDSLIISVPFSNAICTLGMLQILHNIQYEILGTSFKTLVRGYITRGSIYHKNGLIFGSGYSKAYRGEGKIGGAPRIVLDSSIVKDAKEVIEKNKDVENTVTILKYLREDLSDGLYFVDYLNPIGSQEGIPKEQIKEERISINEFIEKSLKSHEDNCIIHTKYKWLENYFNITDIYFK